jgi:hypothetical protein
MLTAGRLRGSLDGAGPGHRCGRDQPGIGKAAWILARVEVVEENDGSAHDRDKGGDQHEYRSLGVHLAVSQICCIAPVKPAPDQQPRQIPSIILSTLASSRSIEGLVPSSGPFMAPLPVPDDESAVPNELVPGAAALVPKAPPPIMDIECEPIPPPRANAAVVERLTHRATQTIESFFMSKLPRMRSTRRSIADDASDVGSKFAGATKLNFIR